MSDLVPCPGCSRHVRKHESSCPFCASSLSLAELPPPPLPRTRLSRAATFAFGATLAGAALVACGGESEEGKKGGGGENAGGSAGQAGASAAGSGGQSSAGSGGQSTAGMGGQSTAGMGGQSLGGGGTVPPYGTPPAEGGGTPVPVYGAAPAD